MHLSVIGSEQILLMCHNVSHVMRKEPIKRLNYIYKLYLYLKYISVILETWDKTCPAIVTAIRLKKTIFNCKCYGINNIMYLTQLSPSIYFYHYYVKI